MCNDLSADKNDEAGEFVSLRPHLAIISRYADLKK